MSYRSRTIALVAVAALCALVPPLLGGRGQAATVPPAAADEVVFPAPGGGPRAVQSFSSLAGDAAYVLDTRAGVYRKLPYVSVRVSPDGTRVAVEDVDGRIGVARRDALRAGDGVRWTSLPPGSPAGWSPDGRALLTTTLDKETRSFTAHRYDLPTGRLRHTPIHLDCDTCTAGWAADSVRYVVRLRGADPELPTGPMRYLNPDGTPGPLVGAEGHLWDANSYSPSRRYAVVEPSRGGGFESADPDRLADWQLPRVLDLSTGRSIRALPTAWPVLGWYDERRVVTAVLDEQGSTVLQVVDVHTGQVGRRVPAPGLPPALLEIGPSAGLTGEAARYGF